VLKPEKARQLMSLIESDLEPSLEIGDNILDILDPDRNTDEIRSDTRGKLLLGTQLRMCG
jgi:hypothetical protein